MSDSYINRMVNEAEGLAVRLQKLDTFINMTESQKFNDLDIVERGLLRQQYSHMWGYHAVLKRRIQRAKDREILGD